MISKQKWESLKNDGLFLVLVLTITITIGIIGYNVENQRQKLLGKHEQKEELMNTVKWDDFIEVLVELEGWDGTNSVGPAGEVGPLQITPIYLRDVNRILGTDLFEMYVQNEHRLSLPLSSLMCWTFTEYYVNELNITEPCWSFRAQLHHRGPRNFDDKKGREYGQRFKNLLLDKVKEKEQKGF